MIYRNQERRRKEAEALNIHVMGTSKRVLGPEHPDTLSTISDLASTYFNRETAAKTEEPKTQELLRKAEELLISMDNVVATYKG